jgi:hypothetical protein
VSNGFYRSEFAVIICDASKSFDRSAALEISDLAPHRHALVKLQHEQDLPNGFDEVWLPDALARKYPRAAREY